MTIPHDEIQTSFIMKLLLFLGHGRLLECYLITLKMIVGINVVTVPVHSSTDAPAALWDLFWYVPQPIIAMPFFCIGVIQLIGIALNYRGVESSWIIRYVGAMFGVMMWLWLIYKSIAIGELHTWLFSLAITTVFFSGIIAWKAWNRLPIPGVVYQA
jgi:hypothetical protein